MGLVLDTGALIAFGRGDRQVAALVEAARRHRDPVLTSSGVVAQAWRGGSRQALLVRLLSGVIEVGLDPRTSRLTGELCAASATSDVVDAHLALLARDGDVLLTGDTTDLRRLLRRRRITASIRHC